MSRSSPHPLPPKVGALVGAPAGAPAGVLASILANILAGAVALGQAPSALAFDVNDKLELNGLLAGAFQCVEGTDDEDHLCRGGAAFQPEVFFNPTPQDHIFVKLGFGAGNGLNERSPFVLAPWAADLEDDVEDINGRDRSYILEAWYAHTFEIAEDNSLQLTGGIVDPAFYMNENAYANDEYTQFMNEAFVNDRTALLPAYDWGAVLVWKVKDWTFTAAGMNLGDNGEGEDYDWYALEADWHVETPLGEGNYRIMYAGTSESFLSPGEPENGSALDEAADPPSEETVVAGAPRQYRLQGFALSYDQALGETFGAFLRIGFQEEDAEVDYRTAYTGGIDIKGNAWGRESDNIALAYGYLEGGNAGIARTDVFEAYYRLAATDHVALTADVQYMKDKYRDGEDPVEGWVLGMRAVLEF